MVGYGSVILGAQEELFHPGLVGAGEGEPRGEAEGLLVEAIAQAIDLSLEWVHKTFRKATAEAVI